MTCQIRKSRKNLYVKGWEIKLIALRAVSKTYEEVDIHLVFVHGLAGSINGTWGSNGEDSFQLWPEWISDEKLNIGVWMLEYPAPFTNWFSQAMSLSDRADGLLKLLLSEEQLQNGQIIFVVHSLGGLTAIQILRNCERESKNNFEALNFLKRVKGIAFLGTPHHGAFLATILLKLPEIIIRPSDAVRDLCGANSNLRDLNHWYRKFCEENTVKNLVLCESRPMQVFGINLPTTLGTVVSLRSSDPGLKELPTQVDKNHKEICKPISRECEVYKFIGQYVDEILEDCLSNLNSTSEYEIQKTEIQKIDKTLSLQADEINTLKESLRFRKTSHAYDISLVDAELKKELESVCKFRFLAPLGSLDQINRLAEKLKNGVFSHCSVAAKDEALAWCARLLATESGAEAKSILDLHSKKDGELFAISSGIITAFSGDLRSALGGFSSIGTQLSVGASYVCIFHLNGFNEANQWLESAKLSFSDLDSDGKYIYVRGALQNGEWECAINAALALEESDYERTPGLLLVSADAFLMRAIPDELKIQALHYTPFNARSFPLRADTESVEFRRKSQALLHRLGDVAKAFGLDSLAGYASDRSLWLKLVDPNSTSLALAELSQSLSDRSVLIRRLHLAVQFGIEVDLGQVEEEVNRITTLSAGTSSDAAVARFALAFTQDDEESVAGYIEKHRSQLLEHFEWRTILFAEVEMLALSGQDTKLEMRLEEAEQKNLTDHELKRLRIQISEAQGSNSLTESISAFKESNSVIDLCALVDVCMGASNWEMAVEYGAILLKRTCDINVAGNLASALYNQGKLTDALEIFFQYPDLKTFSSRTKLLLVRIYFESGNLNMASALLEALQSTADSSIIRQLQIEIAIVSGDWDSLQGFIENEWRNRSFRSANELLQAGRIAQEIGAVRGEELIREAASLSSDDPEVLVNCYLVASKSGWEDSFEAAGWLESALRQSEDKGSGPIKAMSLEDVVNDKPRWDEHEASVQESLINSEVPMFLAGKSTNRSLLKLFLQRAIANRREMDPRKRSLIYAFSGARNTVDLEPKTIALDPTAIMTAKYLGMLDLYSKAFDKIVLPHNTLSWLYMEKADLKFHQPSRIKEANEIRRFVSADKLKIFEESADIDDNLLDEVGERLASMISVARLNNLSCKTKHFAVRSGKVYKPNSYLTEEAELNDVKEVLLSTLDLVIYLKEKGSLTHQEYKQAYAEVKFREGLEPSKNMIADGSILYLDDLVVTQLLLLSLLDKILKTGISIFVSKSIVSEADEFIAYEHQSSEIEESVDRIREFIKKGLESNKVVLGKAVRDEVGLNSSTVLSHPTASMVRTLEVVDACIVDDRYLNQYSSMSCESIQRPTLTTLDVLDLFHDRSLLSREEMVEARTKLRQANFVLVPITSDELILMLKNTLQKDGSLVATAELLALRECMLTIKMWSVLQSPKELSWLINTKSALLSAIRELWSSDSEITAKRAQSNWLFELGEIRGWTHCLNEDVQAMMGRYRSWLLSLSLLLVDKPLDLRRDYYEWLEFSVLESLKVEDRETYLYLVSELQKLISSEIQKIGSKLDEF